MEICNENKNAKYIGYTCVVCNKSIDESERQKIISLGFFQTWCMLCAQKRFPGDRLLTVHIVTNGNNDTIIDRNRMLN